MRPGVLSSYAADKSWWDAMKAPGHNQMKYLKRLMLAFPFTDRVADQSVITSQNGERYDRIIATRGNDYILVYNYSGKPMTIDLTKISGDKKRLGGLILPMEKTTYIGEFDNKVTEFTNDGAYMRNSDRVLIITDSIKEI